MKMPRPTEADKDLFRQVCGVFSEATIKPMFGQLGAFVNGNMFAGLLGSRIAVKLIDEQSRDELLAIAGTEYFAPGGRPMKQFVVVPAAWSEQPELISEWALVALAQVSALPPKKTQPKMTT
jgi:TfoX/Sxy family transcriptional regulator of competence genes